MARRWREAIGRSRVWRWLQRAWSGLTAGSWGLAALRLVIVLAALGIGALLFVSAGLVPVAASQGHWPITRVLLHFAMIRSVQTHALAVKRPPPVDRALDERAMVLKGAGHYASGCLPCHGAPGQPRAEVVRHIVPQPPYLPPKIEQWSDKQLFWIVKHGIKYTAMPAWPSQQRDDEVWAMVAFLRRLPELQPAQFRRLAYGDSAAVGPEGTDLTLFDVAVGAASARLDHDGAGGDPGTVSDAAFALRVADCSRCHGRESQGTGAFPRLAGQKETYLLASLRAYARGERHSGVMEPVAVALGAGEMRALAGYYAALPVRGAGAGDGSRGSIAAEAAPTRAGRSENDERETGSIERGERLARRGDAALRIPSCVECHGPGDGARNPLYPRLAGQHPDYLALQLQLFKQGRRGGTAYSHIMETIAGSLEDADIDDLAAWYGSLPPSAASTAPRAAAD
ncbi:c-type cytochrome [Novilysobacter erysipheiresistens]|uniref:C-type cytochrome n=1 Tax=Novilysobacter erysipheiresistens TaxID=1749332 RepID=A0ABU7YYT5_9GAMM